MKLSTLFSLLILCSCSTEKKPFTGAHSQPGPVHPYLKQRIDLAMEKMEFSDWGLSKMAKKNEFNSPDFIDSVKLLHRQMLTIPPLNHPEKEFRELTDRCISRLKNYLDNASAEKAVLKKNWRQINKSCTACHHVYD